MTWEKSNYVEENVIFGHFKAVIPSRSSKAKKTNNTFTVKAFFTLYKNSLVHLIWSSAREYLLKLNNLSNKETRACFFLTRAASLVTARFFPS